MHKILPTNTQFEEAQAQAEIDSKPYYYYYNNRQGGGCMRSKKWRWYVLACKGIPQRQTIKIVGSIVYYQQHLQHGKKKYTLECKLDKDSRHSQYLYKVDKAFLSWLLGTDYTGEPQQLIDQVRGCKYRTGQEWFSVDWITRRLMRVIDRSHRKRKKPRKGSYR